MDCYHVQPPKQKPSQANTQANTENIQLHMDSWVMQAQSLHILYKSMVH